MSMYWMHGFVGACLKHEFLMSILPSKRLTSAVLAVVFAWQTTLAGSAVSACGVACCSAGRQRAGREQPPSSRRGCCQRASQNTGCCTDSADSGVCCCRHRATTETATTGCQCQCRNRSPVPAVPSPNRTPQTDETRLTLFVTAVLPAPLSLGAGRSRHSVQSAEWIGTALSVQARLCIWRT